MRFAALLFASLALFGCNPLVVSGDDCYHNGQFDDAADWYDKAYRQSAKHDPKLLARRDDARRRALAEVEGTISAGRSRGDLKVALAGLGKRAALRTRWGLDNSYSNADRAWILDMLRTELRPLVDAGRALAAEQKLAERTSALQVDFSVAPLAAEIHQLGLRNCTSWDDAIDDDEQPYLAGLLARYCGHFGHVNDVAAPADSFSGVTLVGRVEGFGQEAYVALQSAALDALMHSGFYDPAAPRRAPVALTGVSGQRYGQADILVDQAYMRRESYWTTESYMESYTTTETYTTTEMSYSTCYSGTSSYSCSSSHPVTRTRTVTRTRPATRTVLRWRMVPDVFHYPARRHTGEYWADWTALAHLGEAHPLQLRLQLRNQEAALEHNITFGPAQIAPSSGRVSAPADWQLRQVHDVAVDLAQKTRQRWFAANCAGSAPTPERAARCARQEGSATPNEAKQALARLFGGETDALLALPSGSRAPATASR